MGGTSSGGSSSGEIDYPDYMEDRHKLWLTQLSDNILAARVGNSPFAGLVTPSPDSSIAAMWSAVCTLETKVDAINVTTNFNTMIATAISRVDAAIDEPTFVNSTPGATAGIEAAVTAWSAIYNEEVDNVTIPKFRGGMRDINAVMSSAFVLGEAYIDAARDRDIAHFQADLSMKSFLQADEISSREAMAENDFNLKLQVAKMNSIVQVADSLLTKHIGILEYDKVVAHYALEAKRLAIAAVNEEALSNIKFLDMDARWDFDIYQYGANMLAAISGGVANPPMRSSASTALGGALSGAGAGAMIGSTIGSPGVGAAIGGLVGLASAFL